MRPPATNFALFFLQRVSNPIQSNPITKYPRCPEQTCPFLPGRRDVPGALFALGWERLLPVGGAAPEAAEG